MAKVHLVLLHPEGAVELVLEHGLLFGHVPHQQLGPSLLARAHNSVLSKHGRLLCRRHNVGHHLVDFGRLLHVVVLDPLLLRQFVAGGLGCGSLERPSPLILALVPWGRDRNVLQHHLLFTHHVLLELLRGLRVVPRQPAQLVLALGRSLPLRRRFCRRRKLDGLGLFPRELLLQRQELFLLRGLALLPLRPKLFDELGALLLLLTLHSLRLAELGLP
mmetsp:Transcript_20452/g.53223  ORF Transcript_20452/g.53223 Transcript_20452/m.53223 type:complete len:218 (+) Transcript_20452:2031-2684(+)